MKEPFMTGTASEWELQLGGRTFPVGKGLTIGRSAEADIVLDDPHVSRLHARVTPTASGLVVEDLKSRHGVRVNGTVVSSRTAVVHGDRIAIAEHLLVAFDRARKRREQMSTVEANPARQPRITRTVRTLAVTAEVDPTTAALAETEDALGRNELPLVVRGLSALRAIIGEQERRGGSDPRILRRYASVALRAATSFARFDWVDAVIDLHAIRSVPMDDATIDGLEAALDRDDPYDRTKLAAYVSALAARATSPQPQEALRLRRLTELAAPRR